MSGVGLEIAALIIFSANKCREAARAYSLGFQPQLETSTQCALKGKAETTIEAERG